MREKSGQARNEPQQLTGDGEEEETAMPSVSGHVLEVGETAMCWKWERSLERVRTLRVSRESVPRLWLIPGRKR